MANIYTPKKAADTIGITSQSIRRYCDRFSRFLSPGACPGPDRARLLTAEDVYILQQVYRLTTTGLTYDEIEEELANLPMPEIVEIEPTGETLPAVPEGLAVLQQMTDTLQGVQEALHTLARSQADTSALHSRLDALTDSQAQQTSQQAEQQARIAQELKQIRRNQEQLSRVTARPIFWATVGAFVGAMVILGAVALAMASGWIG
jgi:DNA-binding transcriptional MerR regulator